MNQSGYVKTTVAQLLTILGKKIINTLIVTERPRGVLERMVSISDGPVRKTWMVKEIVDNDSVTAQLVSTSGTLTIITGEIWYKPCTSNFKQVGVLGYLMRYGKALVGTRVETSKTVARKGGMATITRYDSIENGTAYYMLTEDADPSKEVPILPFESFWIDVGALKDPEDVKMREWTPRGNYGRQFVNEIAAMFGEALVGLTIMTRPSASRQGGFAIVVEFVPDEAGGHYLLEEKETAESHPGVRTQLVAHEAMWVSMDELHDRVTNLEAQKSIPGGVALNVVHLATKFKGNLVGHLVWLPKLVVRAAPGDVMVSGELDDVASVVVRKGGLYRVVEYKDRVYSVVHDAYPHSEPIKLNQATRAWYLPNTVTPAGEEAPSYPGEEEVPTPVAMRDYDNVWTKPEAEEPKESIDNAPLEEVYRLYRNTDPQGVYERFLRAAVVDSLPPEVKVPWQEFDRRAAISLERYKDYGTKVAYREVVDSLYINPVLVLGQSDLGPEPLVYNEGDLKDTSVLLSHAIIKRVILSEDLDKLIDSTPYLHAEWLLLAALTGSTDRRQPNNSKGLVRWAGGITSAGFDFRATLLSLLHSCWR